MNQKSSRNRIPPNQLQKAARGFVRWLINRDRPPDPPVTPPVKGTEAWYRDRLATLLEGKTEVSTPDGRIDILTTTEVIEVKAVQGWKHALGQVLSYGQSYPHHRKRIHLYGEATQKKLQRIQAQCQKHGVSVSWE